MQPESQPAPDFSDPVGLLRACHGRIEHFVGLARRAAEYRLDPPDPAVPPAAARILRYFDQAAPLHHADEEQDLLPLLRAHAGEELAQLLAGLAAEHAELDRRWGVLRPLLAELAAGSGVAPEPYRRAAVAFEEAMLDHLERENTHLLPAAEARLTATERRRLGAAMARRRGVGQNT
jgi:hemerythrin-like domain-containing protein